MVSSQQILVGRAARAAALDRLGIGDRASKQERQALDIVKKIKLDISGAVSQAERIISAQRAGGRKVGGRTVSGGRITKPTQPKSLTPTQIKRAQSLTEEAQVKEFGGIVAPARITPIQRRRAEVLTEREQRKRFGQVIVKQQKTRFIEATFPKGHPRAGQKVRFRVGIPLLRKLQTTPSPIRQEVKKEIIKQGRFGGRVNGKVIGTITESKQKGIKEFISKKSEEVRQTLEKRESKGKAPFQFKGGGKLLATSAVLGIARAGLSIVETISHPIQTAKGIGAFIKDPKPFLVATGVQLKIDPVGTVVEFITFSKGMTLVGKAGKRSKVGRTVQEEIFIRSQPIQIQAPVRAIIKSSKVQEKINPFNVKTIKRIDLAEVKSLNIIEARALKKTLQQTDSVIFGSAASRTLSKSKTPIPKDVDLATGNINNFNQVFLNNLPKSLKKDYALKGQKIIRRIDAVALLDIKPISRLIPQRSILTRRGFLPVSGFVKRIGLKKESLLPTIKRKKVVGAAEVPTQKIIRVEGIRLVGFGEQTTRKGLGTLQVLIEKNLRRAKDPQSFLISLEVQLQALKLQKPKTTIRRSSIRRKIRILESALKILKSKSFANLLEKAVPGLTKEFPILKKIDKKKLKQIKPIQAKQKAIERVKQIRISVIKNKPLKRLSPVEKRIKKIIESRLPKRKRPSKLPSKLPKKKPSKLPPSKLPKRKIPSRLPLSRLPSRIPSGRISKIPLGVPSKIDIGKPSKIDITKPSSIPSGIPSRLPKGGFPSLIPSISRKGKKPIRIIIPPKLKQLEKDIKKAEELIDFRFIFVTDVFSRLFEKKATRKQATRLLKSGKIFSGVGDLRLIIPKKIKAQILRKQKIARRLAISEIKRRRRR